MEAGYLVGKWIEGKLKEMGTNGVIAWLSGSVGKIVAKKIVAKVAQAGVTAAAGYIAGLLGASGSIAGPIGAIVHCWRRRWLAVKMKSSQADIDDRCWMFTWLFL